MTSKLPENDELLSLWLAYAINVCDSQVVYRYMFEETKIGLQSTRFYTYWAVSIEKYLRDFKQCSEIYQLGLNTITDPGK
jgi:hypothetical protein